jgi:hypothetical protein
MRCIYCKKVGVIRENLLLKHPICDSHLPLIEKLEDRQNRYFNTRNRVRREQTLLNVSAYTKRRARYATRLAISCGAIEKTPCSVCGDINAEVHHLNYNDPMNILCLCKKHHKEWHKNNEVVPIDV